MKGKGKIEVAIGPIVKGIFLVRLNRFAALVEVKGEKTKVFVPNSGRMEELLLPGVMVGLKKVPVPSRQTIYDLVLVEHGDILVCVDARLPNQIVLQMLAREFPAPSIQSEPRYRGGRFDFFCKNGGEGLFVEAKSVTLVKEGKGLFPDAPTERGRRHLKKLMQAVGEGYRARVIFVVQRSDARAFAPHDEMDPAFGQALRQAVVAGVEVEAWRCRVESGKVVVDRPLPLLL